MPHFTHSGHRLSYCERGAGPLLLILPGNTATSACHEGELAHFGSSYHTVSMDFWGTGQSDRLVSWPDDWFEQAAHDAAALVAHLGEEEAIVMGTSGGAVVALWMAVLHPHRVKVVVADSTIATYPPEALLAELADRERRTPDQIAFWQGAQGEDWAQVVDADSDMLRRLARHGGRMVPEALGLIACPVLLTALLDDELLPDVAGQLPEMACQIPDTRLVLAKGGGHPMMWSHARQFRTVCDAFLAGNL